MGWPEPGPTWQRVPRLQHGRARSCVPWPKVGEQCEKLQEMGERHKKWQDEHILKFVRPNVVCVKWIMLVHAPVVESNFRDFWAAQDDLFSGPRNGLQTGRVVLVLGGVQCRASVSAQIEAQNRTMGRDNMCGPSR